MNKADANADYQALRMDLSKTYRSIKWSAGFDKEPQKKFVIDENISNYCILKFREPHQLQHKEDCLLFLDTKAYIASMKTLAPYYSLFMPQSSPSGYSYNLIWKYANLQEIHPKVRRCFDREWKSDATKDYMRTQHCLYAYEYNERSSMTTMEARWLPYHK